VRHDVTVPNVITATRFAMAMGAAWLATRTHGEQAAVVVCIVAAVLDAADGWCARAFGQISRVGEHMDPLADKVLMGVVYGWVGIDAASPLVWSLIAAVAVREAAVTVFRAYSLHRHGRYIPASPLGRAKMLVQSVVGLVILGTTHLAGRSVPVAVVGIALTVILILSYASAVAYAIDWRRGPLRDSLPAVADDHRVAANS
jgi:phosphatidylglycerophosphate synthase